MPAAAFAARAIEAGGVLMIVAGLLRALFRAAAAMRRGRAGAFASLRSDIALAILIGLELLVAADIIATITAPQTQQTVGLLAAIILIRTFLSFSLQTEIEGRWPWRREAARSDPARAA